MHRYLHTNSTCKCHIYIIRSRYWSTYVAIRLVLHPYIAYKAATEYTGFMGVYDTALLTSLLALLCTFNVGLLGKQLMDYRNDVPLPGSLRKRESDDKR